MQSLNDDQDSQAVPGGSVVGKARVARPLVAQETDVAVVLKHEQRVRELEAKFAALHSQVKNALAAVDPKRLAADVEARVIDDILRRLQAKEKR